MIFRRLISFAFLLPTCALCQAGQQPLTLPDAVAMAQSKSPLLLRASAITDRASAMVRASRAYANPAVEVFGGLQNARQVPTPGVPGILQHYAAYQAIEVPRERRLRREVANSVAESVRYGQQAISRSVVADVKHAFFNALRRQEEIHHAEENLQLVNDLHRRVEVEVSAGEKGRLELTRAEAELARAQFTVRSAQIEYSNAIALLREAIAAPSNANLDPVGSLDPKELLPPLEQVQEQVLRLHPALAETQAELQSNRYRLEHERALRIPQPTAFGEFENQPDLRFWRVGLTIPIPLWDRRQGQIAEAAASIRQNDAELNQRRLELISAVERSYEHYQLADQQVTSLESGALRAAESAVDAAQAAYRFGERGIVEVLDAQRVLQSVRGDLLDAQFERQAALIDLEELGAVTPGAKP